MDNEPSFAFRVSEHFGAHNRHGHEYGTRVSHSSHLISGKTQRDANTAILKTAE